MIAFRCPKCNSPHLRKNRRTTSEQQKYHCKACDRYGTLETQAADRQRQWHWDAYTTVLPSKRHRPVNKGSGETNHIERFNNTLRQRCSSLVRKTLSFSRNIWLHEKRIRLFIKHDNPSLSV